MSRVWSVLVCVLFLASIEANSDNKLVLSSSATISWDKTVTVEPLFAPSFQAFLLSGNYQGTEFRGQVRRMRPLVMATPIGVERYWNANFAAVKRVESPGKNLGCHKTGSGVFSCVREAKISANEFVYDQMVFNHDRDVLHVRVTSSTSQDHAKQISRLMQVEVK